MMPPSATIAAPARHERSAIDAPEPAPSQAGPLPADRPRPRKWNVREFSKMIEVGLVRGRVDLVDGQVIEMPAAMGNKHSISRERVTRWLHETFPRPYFVHSQETHRFAEDLTREPDAALLSREPLPNETLHELPLLVVEVSDDSLHYDLAVKRLEYARMGVQDYWVIDIPHRRVRVFREPDVTATDPERAYRIDLVVEGDSDLSPLCKPDAKTTPNALLPPPGF